MKRFFFLGVFVLLAATARAETAGVFDVDTYLAMRNVSGVRVSPDGDFLAYTISSKDLQKDSSHSAVWMQATAGGEPMQMTAADGDAWSPKWSPDNRYLAILTNRGDSGSQVWLLDRRGGEAQQLTEFNQGVRSYEWSPDSTKLLLMAKDPSPADLGEEPPPNPPPYVIDRLQFKRDYVGYLDHRRNHIYVIDIVDRKTHQVTSGDFDDSGPTWTPDGEHIAFVSNRTDTPDRNRNTDLWRVSASEENPQIERLTNSAVADSNPNWSPNGKLIAYISNVSDGLPIYAIPQLAFLDVETGRSQLVEALAEVQVFAHQFSDDGQSILAITEYRGEQQLVRVDVESGAIQSLIERENTVHSFSVSDSGKVYALVSQPQSPAEIYRLDSNRLQQISTVNRDLLSTVDTGAAQKYTFKAGDGTDIDTFIVFPPGYKKGKRYPAVLHLHGGPWGQWSYGFDYESQLFAALGYVVIMPNPRGSFGYGQEFTDALTRDWGGIDYGDVMSAVDFAIEKGWVDEDRMAVYGWSYGGFLTNHVITKTDRFKAAISGASETLVAANYGHDEWQRLWEEEFGSPWLEENRQAWQRISPFYSLDKVTTPTLVVGGEDDWNMPILNSEQLFAALKRRGVPTLLVVYPGQSHSLSVPSYEKDLYERYADWLNQHVTN